MDNPLQKWDAAKLLRFLDDLRETQSIDAEAEFTELCSTCGQYPVAIHSECFTCQTSGKVMS